MASIDEIREQRLKKLSILKERGIDPYPISCTPSATLFEIVSKFSIFSKKKNLILAGRVMSLRAQGAIIFLNFFDGTDIFQAFLKKDDVKDFVLFSDTVDIGDFIEFSGSLFITKRGEKTIAVKKWRMLSKSLRPLPEKWHGLQDIEERFRKRYLDSLMSKEVRDRFVLRSRIITEMRKILDNAGYLEVETPVLQPLYGGASAEPFITKHNTLDMDLYLRISDELYLKRMLVGGFSKIYEIARDFRNEGIDSTHNPEFTMIEFYESFSDSSKQMIFVEKMVRQLAKISTGKTKIIFDGENIDFSKKFAVISYYDLIKRNALIPNPESISEKDLLLKASQLGINLDLKLPKSKILDAIYKKSCRSKLIQPTFVIDYPAEYLPLAKRKVDNIEFVDAFQLIAGGIELAKAFSELNDPIDQKERLSKEEKNKESGDKEAQSIDLDFIEAMEYGMPPAGGVGIGIDRLAMLLSDTKNIKEVIFFPTMKNKQD